MREYEIMFVLRPDLGDGELDSLLGKIREDILKRKGAVTEFNFWQRRQLAYPIGKYTEGIYLLGYFKLPQEAPRELSREWKLNLDILRFLILKKE